MRYLRQELLALRYWWKIPTTSGFQTARFSGSHYEIKPLSEHLWKNLKQTGILKRLRGCRGGRPRNVISSSSATFLPHLPSLDSSNSSIAVGSEQRIIHNVDANAESVISQVTSPASKKYVNFCLWNAQSIKNKTACFSDYLCEKKIDLAALTETWFNNFDSAVKAECLPDGYKLFDIARKDQRGGGIALVYRNNFVIKAVDSRPHYESFEAAELILTSSQTSRLRLSIIYRPPYSSAHPVCTGTFITEFSNYLESFVLCMEPVVICGDFNIHIDDESDPYSTALTDLLQSMALKQHVCIPTQHHGHTLDLIITRDSDNLITDPPVTDTFLSDHATVLCNLSIFKGKPITRDVTFRKLKSIDLEVFTDDLRASELLLDPPTLLTDLVRSYNTTLSSLPTLTNMLNLSMQTGEFPEVWKEALVTTILKREGLDTIFKNYRPISNLQFVSKLVERAVADQLYSFMAENGLLPELQSAYRPGHSTETALLKVKNDLR